MANTLQNNMEFQFTGTLLASDTAVTISVDLERSAVVAFTDAYIEVRNKKGNKIERMKGTASAGTLTLSKRGLDQSATDVEVAGLKLQRNEGTIAYVTILSVQLVDKTSDNTFATGTLQTFDRATFVKGPYSTVYANTAARDAALGGNGVCLYPYTGILAGGVFYNYNTATAQWEDIDTGTTTPFMSTTVAGIGELSTQTETEQQTAAGGTGAPLLPTNVTINPANITSGTIVAGDKISFSDASDSNFLKSTTIQGILNLITSMYWGDGSDGDVVLSGAGTTTLTRDMQYNNLTITSPAVLDPAGYRIFVRGTLSGTGTISRNGNSGSNGGVSSSSPTAAGGAAGTTLGQGSLNAEIGAGAGGNGASPGVAGTAGTASTLSLSNISSVAGGAGGTGGSGAGGAGGALAASTRGANYNTILSTLSILFHIATAQGSVFAAYKGKASSGGGGGGTGNSDAGGGGGGAGGNGGLIWIASYIWSFTGTVTATGGAGGAGGAGSFNRGGGGGGGGGNGGTLLRMYHTIPNDGTITLTGGAGGAGGAIGSGVSTAGTNGTTGATGETISIVI